MSKMEKEGERAYQKLHSFNVWIRNTSSFLSPVCVNCKICIELKYHKQTAMQMHDCNL
jgi:hypothetical protein